MTATGVCWYSTGARWQRRHSNLEILLGFGCGSHENNPRYKIFSNLCKCLFARHVASEAHDASSTPVEQISILSQADPECLHRQEYRSVVGAVRTDGRKLARGDTQVYAKCTNFTTFYSLMFPFANFIWTSYRLVPWYPSNRPECLALLCYLYCLCITRLGTQTPWCIPLGGDGQHMH